jgi:hypothetical protein
MARMVPEKDMNFHSSYGEKAVYGALRKLPDEYVVFHSVKWNDRDEKGEKTNGESDFTVFHPLKGAIVVEVKSGGMTYIDGKWFQTRMDNGRRYEKACPLSQAGRSKDRFVRELERRLPGGYYCMVEQAVWFSSVASHDVIGELPPRYAKEIILLEDALQEPQKFIDRIYSYYKAHLRTHLNKETSEIVINALAPLFHAVASMSSQREEHEAEFLRMTHEQCVLLDFMEEQQVAAIHGSAGTGKTVLAVEKARRLANDAPVLFLCFNVFLFEHLQKTFPNPRIKYTNLYTLACEKKNVSHVDSVDILSFLENCDRYGWEYRHIVVDEGQDFEDREIVMLRAIASKNQGYFYVFYDKNQLVQKPVLASWFHSHDCRLILSRNCRNTFQIALTSGKPINLLPRLPDTAVQGETPCFYIVSDRKSLLKQLDLLISKYTSNGFSPDQICILTLKTEASSILHDVERIGKHKITRSYSPNKALFTTVRKFKGLEADVVIIVDISKATFLNDTYRRTFYVGASRAKHHLDIIFQGNEDELSDFSASLGLDAENAEFGVGASLQNISDRLGVRALMSTVL